MVITLDKRKKPLGFCSERRARKLLEKRRACVYRYYPFTIIIKDIDTRKMDKDKLPVYRMKIDPGSKTTGISIVREEDNTVMLFAQIEHRGQQIKKNLDNRRATRRNRRNRETRYRRCKYKDGGNFDSQRPEGWLPPSVKSIGDNIISWIKRFQKLVNIQYVSFEAVRFDTQLMDNPNIQGEEYQQGTLLGYEIREYLLDKYGHTCQYCGGTSGDAILEWEHIQPKSKGGSDSVKNATLACHTCNQDKGNLTLSQWKEKEDAILNNKKASSKRKQLAKARLKGIAAVEHHKPQGIGMRYCAWVNSTRRYVEKHLYELFHSENVECASGGRTKHNRTKLQLAKDHHYDALCVGQIPEEGYKDKTNGYVMHIKAIGRGSRFRGKINKCGIITTKLKRSPKKRFGFQNGDIVAADVPKGKYAGHHVGRVMTRARGSFDIRRTDGTLVGVNHKYCRLLQHDSGYQYKYIKPIPLGN